MGQNLVEALRDLKLGDHVCSIYETKEQMVGIVPFIMQGIERSERCLYIADENSVAEVMEAFERQGVNVSALIRSGRLSIITKVESYIREGHFDPDKMISLIRDTAETAVREGYKGLCATGEMTWSLAGHQGSEKLIEYEAKLNYFFPQSRALAVCQYNADKFPAETLTQMLKVHPLVIYGDFVCRNFYYVPPDEFLREEKDPKYELDRCLRYLQEREGLERKLREYVADLDHKIRELNALNAMFTKHLAEHFELQQAYGSMMDNIKMLTDMMEAGKKETGLSEDILHPHTGTT
ncbi:MAG: MEDS domain-containing protein [Chloroflexi bacterium]|nr:MEDS domain-containing protein [Chloroflexota bacterium]